MAILTVNPNGSAMYTTLSAAILTAAYSDIIEIEADIVENLIYYKDVSEIRGKDGVRPKWTASTSSPHWTINGAMGQPVHVHGIDFVGSLGGHQVELNATTYGQQVLITDCKFYSNAINGFDNDWAGIRVIPQGLQVENLIVDGCTFGRDDGESVMGFGVIVDQSNTSESIKIYNCDFTDGLANGSNPDRAAIYARGGWEEPVIWVFNCTIRGWYRSINTDAKGLYTNNIFTDCNEPVLLAGNAAREDFSYNVSSEPFDASTEWGPGNVWGVSDSSLFVAWNDHHLVANSPAIGAGINLYSIMSPYNNDLEGTARPVSGSWDAGAFAYGGAIVTAGRRRIIII